MVQFSEVRQLKKKISLLLCILMTVLVFAGCSGKGAEGISDEQQDSAKVISEYMVGMFASMGDEGLTQFMEMSDYELNYQLMAMNYQNEQYGMPSVQVDGETFISMIKAWQAAEDECGTFVDNGDYSVEEKNTGLVVSTMANFEDRKATIAFTFDEELQLDSLDVSAKYTLGEVLKKAGLNTLLGMGTVFVVLIFLAFIISLMKYIPMFMDKLQKKGKEKPVETKSEEVAVESEDVTDDLELVAVITAAIAASEETSTDGFVVRSIKKRRPSNNWN